MTLPTSVTDVARNFAAYVNRVAFRGERFLLMRGNKPVAELGPVPGGRRLGDLPALFASLPRLTADEATAFERDLSQARAELSNAGTHDPWAS